MVSLQRALAVLLMIGSISSYASSLQNEHDQLNDFEKTDARTKPVYPPWVSVPQTTDDFDEYSEIADDVRYRLAKVFEHELIPTYTLFVQYFDQVEDAVTRMIYPYEKKGSLIVI
jgi:hypothetical protein